MLESGLVVKSVAGHDKDSFYVVVAIDGDRAFIADGNKRKLEKPKAKNFAHLKKTNYHIDLKKTSTNKMLKREIKNFLEKEGEPAIG